MASDPGNKQGSTAEVMVPSSRFMEGSTAEADPDGRRIPMGVLSDWGSEAMFFFSLFLFFFEAISFFQRGPTSRRKYALAKGKAQ